MKKTIAFLSALLILLSSFALADGTVPVDILVVDNEACTIRITGYDPDDWNGASLKVYLANKTGNKTLKFMVENGSVNGFAAQPSWEVSNGELYAGTQENLSLSFPSHLLASNGITTYTDIKFSFKVYDNDSYAVLAEQAVNIYPYGEENVETYSRPVQPTDVVIVDNDEITIIVTGCGKKPYLGFCVDLYLANKTDAPVTFQMEDATINDTEVDSIWLTTIPAGKVATNQISWFDSTLEKHGITTVQSVIFPLIAYKDSAFYDPFFAQDIFMIP